MPKEYQYKEYIQNWKNGIEDGLRGEYQISCYIKTYLFKKYKNNREENLILLCPNCHSLTSTYKGANVNHGRKTRKKYSK